MSVEHMAMVFAADGLDGSEKLLLLAYANYTDPHGYCWPGEDRLAEDTGTSVSTVRRTKKKLIGKNLVRSVRRAETSNLARVNLPLLASMGRVRKAYDDNEMERLSFGPGPSKSPSDQRTVQSDLCPGQVPDLGTVQSDLTEVSDCSVGQVNLTCAGGQSDLQSISDPSGETTTSPSRPQLELVPDGVANQGGGGGGDAPKEQEKPDQVAAAFVDRLPYGARLPGTRERSHLVQLVAQSLAAGWTEWALRVQLTEETDSAKSLAAVYRHRLQPENLPAAPPVPKPRAGTDQALASPLGQRAKCPECHRPLRNSTEDALCSDCREDASA